MKRRLRWFFEINGASADVRDVVRRIVESEYSERSARGFIVHESNSARLRAVFVERLKVEQSIEDPWGTVQTVSQIEYRRIHFQWDLKQGQLELADPPRTIGPLLERLHELGNGLAIERPTIDVAKWLALVEKRVKRLQVRSLLIANAPLALDVRASVSMRGERDIRPEAERWLRKGVASIESAELAWRSGRDAEWVVCQLSVRGASFERHVEEEVGPILRESVFASMLP